jgi:glucose/arabinose dehydrogenase
MKRVVFCLPAAVVFSFVAAFTQPAAAISQGNVTVTLNQFATIPGADGTPQDLESANDGTGRLFVTTRNGMIDILNSNGTSAGTFLNMPTSGTPIFTGGEGGLFGLAFSPTYATDGKFFTYQTEPYSDANPADYSEPELKPTTSINPSNQITIRQWTVSGNQNVANTTSTVLMRLNHAVDTNHQGGSLKFGPDGFLYFGTGDGGGSNDAGSGGASSNVDGHTNSIGNGQDLTVPLGKIMRIDPLRVDPNGINSTNGKYAIPSSNPFATDATGKIKEVYAYGVRNPFRMSFDSATGKLWLGDVGQSAREEVDNIANGGNYGWPFREGFIANGAGRTLPVGFTSTDPIADYTHSDGIAIMGGFVYHGSLIPSLQGKYIFGDLGGASGATGRLFYMDTSGGTISELKYQGGVTPSSNLYGFGQNDAGELYAFFSNGNILAIVPEPASATLMAIAAIGLPLMLRRRLRHSEP